MVPLFTIIWYEGPSWFNQRIKLKRKEQRCRNALDLLRGMNKGEKSNKIELPLDLLKVMNMERKSKLKDKFLDRLKQVDLL